MHMPAVELLFVPRLVGGDRNAPDAHMPFGDNYVLLCCRAPVNRVGSMKCVCRCDRWAPIAC